MKEFAMISQSLLHSKKFNALETNLHRLAYIFTHLRAEYSCVFSSRVAEMALDLQCDTDEAQNAIIALIKIGLIDYDFDEEKARILGWYHKANAPSNKSQLIAQIRGLESKSSADSLLFIGATAELATASILKAERWKEQGEDARRLLKEFILAHFYEDSAELLDAFEKELVGKKAARKLLMAIFPMLNPMAS